MNPCIDLGVVREAFRELSYDTCAVFLERINVDIQEQRRFHAENFMLHAVRDYLKTRIVVPEIILTDKPVTPVPDNRLIRP